MENKIKIVIADDNKGMCDLIEKYLSTFDEIEILGIANTDEQEIEMIEKFKPEIVITDLMRNGKYGALDIIKEYFYKNSEVEFLVISADEEKDVIRDGLRVAGYIKKPFYGHEIIYKELKRIKKNILETRINKLVDEKENNVKLKVVVADDMEVIAKNMQSIIAGNSKVEKVWTAFDGEEEIIQIMKLEPDIVFTDNQMPKRTGLEVIEAIKEYPCIRKQPKFILVTADRDNELVLKSRELGFDIVYKPISNQKINQFIDEFEFVEIDNKDDEIKMKKEIEEVRKELRKEGFLKKLFKKV